MLVGAQAKSILIFLNTGSAFRRIHRAVQTTTSFSWIQKAIPTCTYSTTIDLTMAEVDVDRFYDRLGKLHKHFIKHK